MHCLRCLVVGAGLALAALATRTGRAESPEAVPPQETALHRPAATTPTETPTKPADTIRHASPGVVPPRLLTTEGVPYPEDGQGDATVELELLILADGSVGEASVVRGADPFAAATLAVALEWRFAPARVGGEARAARVRVASSFREEPPRAADLPETSEAPAPELVVEVVPDIPTSASPIEVSVYGERPVVGRTSLSKLEIQEIAGAFGDPFRAVEVLPAITPIASGMPFFFIRGAPPGNQGYFFDGIRVPLLYHLALGPGVIHPELVERVDLYAGGYPARYGRFVGGIVAAKSSPPKAELHGSANVRVIDAGGFITAPFGGGRGVATAAGRYSYTGRIIQLIEPSIRLQYWDYQLRTRWQATDTHAFEVFSFGAFDLYRQDTADSPYRLGTEFHRLDLRHDFETRKLRGRVAATLGTDRTRDDDSTSQAAETTIRDRLVAARFELEHRHGSKRLHRGGADVTVDRYDAVFGSQLIEGDPAEDEQLADHLPSRTDVNTGAWSDVVFHVAPHIELVAGARVDLFVSDSAAALGIDPRVAVSFSVHPRVKLVHALGIVHQPASFVVPVPGFAVSGLDDGLQRGVQSSAGVEAQLPANIEGSFVLFQHAVFNGTDLLSLATREDAIDDSQDELSVRSLGHTYGAELLLRRSPKERLGGFLAYTLSRSERSFGKFSGASSFDRRHVVNAGLSYDLGRRWRASTRFVFYTGIPAEVRGCQRVFLRRTTPFVRLDWRVQKRWLIGNSGAWWAFTAEVLNTTLNQEQVRPACPDGSCDQTRIGPVTVPALGVEAAF